MELFYLILGVVSLLFLVADLALYLAFKMKSFGENWEIFVGKNKVIDLQVLFPKNLTLIIVFIFAFSLCGFVLGRLNITGWISAPCGFVFAILVNITAVKLFPDFYERANGKALKKGDFLDGCTATVISTIEAEDYGEIRLVHNKRKYDFYAVSANETVLEKGTKVIIIDEIDGFCYVQGEDEIYDILEEEAEKLDEETINADREALEKTEKERFDVSV